MSDQNMIPPVSVSQQTLVVPAVSSAPALAQVPAQPPNLGQAQQNYLIQGLDRVTAGPEDANADLALARPEVYHRSAILQVPGVIWIQGTGLLTRADYNVLSNYQYFRDGMSFVNAQGRNDQEEYVMWTSDNITFNESAPYAPNFVLGAIIEWSVQLQVSSAFTMHVETNNFTNISAAPVDRSFDLRLGPGSTPNSVAFANGGMFAFLFGQRMSTSDKCGCIDGSGCVGGTGSANIGGASGGMMKAVIQPAWVQPTNPPDYTSADLTTHENPYILGLTAANGTPDKPNVKITVPSAIGTGFGAVVRWLTAASPAMAAVQTALRASGQGLEIAA